MYFEVWIQTLGPTWASIDVLCYRSHSTLTSAKGAHIANYELPHVTPVGAMNLEEFVAYRQASPLALREM